jgi:hypothetical protein
MWWEEPEHQVLVEQQAVGLVAYAATNLAAGDEKLA